MSDEVFATDLIELKTARGFTISLPRDRIPAQQQPIERDGVYEEETELLIHQLVKPGQKVVDIGACCGYHSLNLATAVGPEGTVYCFEANPELVPIVVDNLRRNALLDRCEVIGKGVWKENTQLEFPMINVGLGTAGFKRAIPDRIVLERRQVDVVSLDEELRDVASEIALLRMDIEGAEFEAIMGARELIAASGCALILEWAKETLSQEDSIVLFDLLTQELGYDVFRIKAGAELEKIASSEEALATAQDADGQTYRDVVCLRRS